MGNRGQVIIEDVGVVLYVHLGGHELYEQVANTLFDTAENLRTDYLVQELVDTISAPNGSTGKRRVGVQSEPIDHTYRTIHLNHEDRRIRTESIYDDRNDGKLPYNEFIEKYATKRHQKSA